jgi:hypothetical protein
LLKKSLCLNVDELYDIAAAPPSIGMTLTFAALTSLRKGRSISLDTCH